MSDAKKILIIEDDVAICEMYEMKLQRRNYQVRTAFNGEDGLAIARSFSPDLILLDLLLPGMHGDEILKALRATDWGSAIRVVVLTNISKDEASLNMRLMNVDRYIVKAHYTPQQVVDIVDEVLAKKGAAV